MSSRTEEDAAVPRASATRLVAPLVGVFAAVVLCLLALVWMQIEVMTGVRAYVGGEGMWSKAQKEAVLSLRQFAASGATRDWEPYRWAIAVPLGDRVARLELMKTHPDLVVVRQGFLAGRNHPDDVDRMAMLVRRFGRIPYMADAIRIWTEADQLVTKLSRDAETLHHARLERPTRDADVARSLHRIRRLNARITPLEDAFSSTLGEGARLLGSVLFVGMLVAAALLLAVGGLLSAVLLHRLEREGRISAALARIGQELISGLQTSVVRERLCDLSLELLGCAQSSTIVASKTDGSPAIAATRRAASDADVLPLAATLFTDSVDVVLMRTPSGAQRLVMPLRRGDEVAGSQVADFAPGMRVTPDVMRIARGLADVGSMALANATLVGELEHASQLKSEFVSTMSHELRTPLNVILGYAEMARVGDSTVPAADLMARIEVSGRDLLGLIESTLEIGKIDAGRDEARIEEVAFETFWTALGEGCARLPRRDGVAFEWLNEVPGLRLATDPRKLTVIVRNLVGNALKFTERGAVRVEARQASDAVVLTVADTGIGIRPEDQAAVFEMFRQADGSDSRRFNGSGLGLYIVRRFVEQLGGTITLASALGEGSTFRIALPVGAQPEYEPRAA